MSKVFRKSLRSAVSYGLLHKRTIYKTFAITASTSITCSYMLMQSMFRHKLKELYQMNNFDGSPVQLPADLHQLAETVFKESHISAKDKYFHYVEFFHVNGSQPYSIGNLATSFGIVVGLPYYFRYKTISDIKTSDLIIAGVENIDSAISSETGNQLKESLVLSENAKKFAIGKEIQLCNSIRFFFNCIVIGLCTAVTLGLPPEIIDRYRLNRKSFATKSLVYLGVYVAGYIVWRLYRDLSNWYVELVADEDTIKQGNDYYEGALEYYKKMQQRNKAFHSLFGEYGERNFTIDGEFKSLWRLKNVSIRERIANINEIYSRLKLEEPTEDEVEDG